MLAEYIIKMTLDNGDSYKLGIITGGVAAIVGMCLAHFMKRRGW